MIPDPEEYARLEAEDAELQEFQEVIEAAKKVEQMIEDIYRREAHLPAAREDWD